MSYFKTKSVWEWENPNLSFKSKSVWEQENPNLREDNNVIYKGTKLLSTRKANLSPVWRDFLAIYYLPLIFLIYWPWRWRDEPSWGGSQFLIWLYIYIYMAQMEGIHCKEKLEHIPPIWLCVLFRMRGVFTFSVAFGSFTIYI